MSLGDVSATQLFVSNTFHDALEGEGQQSAANYRSLIFHYRPHQDQPSAECPKDNGHWAVTAIHDSKYVRGKTPEFDNEWNNGQSMLMLRPSNSFIPPKP